MRNDRAWCCSLRFGGRSSVGLLKFLEWAWCPALPLPLIHWVCLATGLHDICHPPRCHVLAQLCRQLCESLLCGVSGGIAICGFGTYQGTGGKGARNGREGAREGEGQGRERRRGEEVCRAKCTTAKHSHSSSSETLWQYAIRAFKEKYTEYTQLYEDLTSTSNMFVELGQKCVPAATLHPRLARTLACTCTCPTCPT